MKKIITVILAMMTTNGFAFPETIMTCTLEAIDEEINITISKDSIPNDELGSFFAIAQSDKSEYKMELFRRLKWELFSSRYMPEKYRVTGDKFYLFNDFEGRVYFSGILFNKKINQRINCY